MNVDVMVCAGGKCGSTTLRHTFCQNGYKSIKFHHENCFVSQFKKCNILESVKISSKNKKLYIVDSYRLPLERKISSFFENLKVHIPCYEKKSISDIINIFNKEHLRSIEEYQSMMNTILNNLHLSHFEEFDFDKKYTVREEKNIIFIRLRFKDIHCWSEILSEIFGKKIKLYSKNLTKDKKIYVLYKKFLEEYKVPRDYLDIIEKDKNFLMYNTLEEQREYLKYWETRSY